MELHRTTTWSAAALVVVTLGSPIALDTSSAQAADLTSVSAPRSVVTLSAAPTSPATKDGSSAGLRFLGPPERTPPPPDALPEEKAVARVRALFGGLKELPYVRAFYNPQGLPPEILPRAGGTVVPTWNLTFSAADLSIPRDPSSPPVDILHADVDAFTGDILGFSRNNPAWAGDQPVDTQMAVKVASQFLQTIPPPFPDWAFVDVNSFSETQITGPVPPPSADPGPTTGPTVGPEDAAPGPQSDSSPNPAGSLAGQTRLDWRYADVRFGEKVNGILFPQNSIHISVDPFGHVVQMRIERPFDSSKLPKPTGVISADQARRALSDQLQLEKQYLESPFQFNAQGQAVPTYQPVLGYFAGNVAAVDAFTGKPVQWVYPSLVSTTINRTYEANGRGDTLVATDRQSAERLLAKLMQIDLSGMTFRSRTLPGESAFGDGYKIYTWTQLPPQSSDSSPGSNPGTPTPSAHTESVPQKEITAVLDAAGHLVTVNMNFEALRGKPATVTTREGEAKAVAFLQQVLPGGTQSLQLARVTDLSNPRRLPDWYDPAKDPNNLFQPIPVYLYAFFPLHQGVPIADHSYLVSVDATTGHVVGFSIPPAPSLALPDNVNTLAADKAKEIFMQNQPIHLIYRWPELGNQVAPQAQLIYEFDPAHLIQYIDALTGNVKFLDRP
ncbi:MAG: hypothetical protein IMX06_04625 [Kyrpidia tusciae]|nr:hypothetical protein [Kyrpidia tusciae]MBE3552137.1 hypothetical protein [Kyrpidia tusciae]